MEKRKAAEDEAKLLVERLVGVNGDDHERFLLNIKKRFDCVGMELPTIEVRAEELAVEAEVHTGRRETPNLLNSVMNTILRMTLLLGSPGSGKTTLLKALAGKLDSGLKVSGRVTYNGRGMEEFVRERTAAYVSQDDLHNPEMTVRETLAFSEKCQGVGDRYA
ncbi:hypothetical protein ACP70R_033667 [Stipagrostis hirtigluma subsp. patula]